MNFSGALGLLLLAALFVSQWAIAVGATGALSWLTEDTVLARLFALNAERAAEERGVLGTGAIATPAPASTPTSSTHTPRAVRHPTVRAP